MNPSLSFFPGGVKDKTSRETITEQELTDGIRSGRWPEVQRYRETSRKLGKEAAKHLKCALPAVTLAGRFDGRKVLVAYSQRVYVDIDGVGPERANEIRSAAALDPYVMAAEVSPSGDGVRLRFRVTTGPTHHRAAWQAAADHFRSSYGAFLTPAELAGKTIDPSVKDITRLCFVTDDPDAHYAPSATPLPVVVSAATAKKTERYNETSAEDITGNALNNLPSGDIELSDAAEMLGRLDPNMPYHEWLQVAAALRNEFRTEPNASVAFELFEQWSAGSAKYDDGGTTPTQLWNSIKPVPANGSPPIKIGTLIQKAGWTRHSKTLKAEPSAIHAFLKSVQFDTANPPPKEPWRFKMGGVEVSTPGNILVVSAPIKSGKSSFMAAGLASTFSPGLEALVRESDGIVDCLGWESDANPDGRAVLHFDTEQSPEDHYRTIERAMRRAGVQKPPTWFGSFCLTGESPAKQIEAIVYAVEHCIAKMGVHSIWIDGIGDLVSSPNEEAECNALVQRLRNLAISAGAPIICSLHWNPGSEKTRGHLGSEIERKAQSVVRVDKDKDGGVTVTMPLKSRGAPLNNGSAPHFAWSPVYSFHVSVPLTLQEQRGPGAPRKHDLISVLGADVLSRSDLRRRAMKTMSKATYDRLLKEALDDGQLIITVDGLISNPAFSALQ